MKTTFFLMTILLSQTAFAQSSGWMFSRDLEVAAASEPALTRAKPAARQPAAKTTRKKAAKKGGNSCAPNYDAAQAMFKEVHGADVDLGRMGQFNGSFKTFTSTNQFKKNGNSLWLNLNIGGMINTDVPVCVRKSSNGKSLTATIITSNAKEAGTNQPQATITQMVASGEAPKSITLSVNRRGKNLMFSGRGAQATAAIR